MECVRCEKHIFLLAEYSNHDWTIRAFLPSPLYANALKRKNCIAPFMPIPHRRLIPFALHLPDNITWNRAVAAPDRVISCRSCSRPAISLFFSRERARSRRYNIAVPANRDRAVSRRSIAAAGRDTRRRYEVCKPPSDSRREFIPLIYISTFDSRACLRATRKTTSGARKRHGANNIFNPLPRLLAGELYEHRRCALNAAALIGSRVTLPSRRRLRHATFPRGFMNRRARTKFSQLESANLRR